MRQALSVVVAGLLVLSGLAAVPTAAGAATAPHDPANGFTTDDVSADRSPTADASADRSPIDESESPTANASDAASSHDACEPVSAGDAPDDPESDRLGWENGCWYDEELSVTTDDGLNETELQAVIGRSMARVEQIRELEFAESVPVEVLSIDEYRSEVGNLTGNATTAERLHQDVKWEATFIVDESTDAVAAQESTIANGTAGFYDPQTDQIRIVSPDPSSVPVAELTLGHELVHALQDQHYSTSYNRSTTDGVHGKDGVVEGDADFVEARYGDRCDADWGCSSPPPADDGEGGSGDVNIGLQINQLVPYSEGSAFVRALYDRGGWEAVNAAYENPPVSAEQVIHPEAYPDERPRELSIDHSPSDGWRVLELENGIDHAAFGEGALYAMMYVASYRESVATQLPSAVVIPYEHFFNFQPGVEEVPDVAPYNYSHPVTDGWDGDRLVPYVTDESAETGETGYVWKLAWDTEADAEEFRDGYSQLIEYYGAEPVEGHENTYRIPDENEYGDAFYVTRDGDTVLVVNAPTVDDLDGVREGAAPEISTTPGDDPTPTATDGDPGDSTPTPTDGDEPTATPTDGEEPTATTTDDGGPETPDPGATTTSDGGPGFGVAAALVGLVLSLLARRRRR